MIGTMITVGLANHSDMHYAIIKKKKNKTNKNIKNPNKQTNKQNNNKQKTTTTTTTKKKKKKKKKKKTAITDQKQSILLKFGELSQFDGFETCFVRTLLRKHFTE